MAAGDLLERDELARRIDDALAEARAGAGRVLVIEGEPGIGKSRLLQELRRRTGAAQRVLFARASELERGFAFGVVRQLFEGAVRDPERGSDALRGAAATARDIFEDVPGAERTPSFALLHGLYWLTLNLAEHEPLVLAIDDLHWCDASSLRFLSYLGRRLEETPILLAATTRPVVPASIDAEPLSELLSEPTATHLYPQALSEAAAGALLTEQLGSSVAPEFTRACFEATDGNPLMLRQLARSLQAEGIEPTAQQAAGVRRAAHRALARTVLARVDRHSPAAIATARAVAALGDTATVELVASVAALETGAVADAWSELVEAEILRRDSLGFVHALVRDAIYFDIAEHDRPALHRRAAEALEGAGASVERIASQLDLTTPAGDPWVAAVTAEAGEAALRRGAPDAAARSLRRALAEPPPPERRRSIMAALAEALFDVDASGAIELLRQLADLEPDPRARAAIQLTLVQTLALTDRWAEATVISRAAEAQLGAEHDDSRAMFEAVRAAATMFGHDDRSALESLEQHRTLPDHAALGHRLRAGLAALWWMFSGGTAEECSTLALRAIQSDPTILRDHTLIAVSPLIVLGMADRDEGLALWEQARADAHHSGSLILHLTVSMWLGITYQRRGALTESIAGLTEAFALMSRWGSGAEPVRFACSALALAHLDAGDLAAARRALDEAPGSPIPTGPSFGGALWWHAQSWLFFAEGRLDEALAATVTLDGCASWMQTPLGVDPHLPRSLILHRLGDQQGALETIEAGLRLAEHWGTAGMIGAALRIRGEITGDDGLDDLRRSVEILDGSSARIQFARSLVTYGAALRLARRPSEARVPLERAYEIAGACGAPGLVELARTELAASGVRRGPGDAAGPGALTPSERRVADLAAGGRSNREIAQELFVTPKTVEVHLSASYRKLGIASRHALAGALIR